MSAIGITLVNIRGVKAAARLQKVLTITIVAVGIILVVASAINGEPSNLEDQPLIGENTCSVLKNSIALHLVMEWTQWKLQNLLPQAAQ